MKVYDPFLETVCSICQQPLAHTADPGERICRFCRDFEAEFKRDLENSKKFLAWKSGENVRFVS